MNNKRPQLITSVIWNWTSLAANLIISFWLVRIILSRLGQTSYGIWVLVGSIVGYYQLLEFGITSAAVRYISKWNAEENREEIRRYFSSIFFLFLGIAILIFCFSAIFSYIPHTFFKIPPHLSRSFRYLILLCGAGIAVSFAGNVFNAALRGVERFDLVNKIRIIHLLLKFSLIYFFLDRSLPILGLIILGSNLLNRLLFAGTCIFTLREHPFHFSLINWKAMKTVVNYSFYSFVITISTLLLFQTDSMVIGYFLGVSQIALFQIGNRLIELLRDILYQVSAPFVPLFSRRQSLGKTEQSEKIFYNAARITAFISALMYGGIAGFGHGILWFWVGDSISEIRTPYLIILILAFPTFLSSAQTISNSLLYGTNKHRFLAWISGAEAFFNLLLSIILVRHWGLYGVAAGTAIPMVITRGIIMPAYISRLNHLPLLPYFFNCLISPVITGSLFFFVCFAVQRYFPTKHFGLFLAETVCTGACAAALLFFLFFSKSERLWIFKVYKEWRTKKVQ